MNTEASYLTKENFKKYWDNGDIQETYAETQDAKLLNLVIKIRNSIEEECNENKILIQIRTKKLNTGYYSPRVSRNVENLIKLENNFLEDKERIVYEVDDWIKHIKIGMINASKKLAYENETRTYEANRQLTKIYNFILDLINPDTWDYENHENYARDVKGAKIEFDTLDEPKNYEEFMMYEVIRNHLSIILNEVKLKFGCGLKDYKNNCKCIDCKRKFNEYSKRFDGDD